LTAVGFVIAWQYEKGTTYSVKRKIKTIEDCFVKNQMQAKPSASSIQKIDRSDFKDILLAACRASIINIEGPPGIGKSSYFAELLEAENAKGTPVAHLELRGCRSPSGCSVANYICYQFGLSNAVIFGNIEMNIDESAKYFEKALRKMKDDGKPTPILVIDDIQILFANESLDYVESSLNFLELLVQWQTQGLIRPILISSHDSIVKYFNRGWFQIQIT
jgi:Cdc6-like AAA superfamily ATPase